MTAFIERVLALRPRVAAFDCDGTLWDADSGEKFFYWELERGIVPPDRAERVKARYAEYRAGRLGEAEMCGEMVTLHEGVAVARIEEFAEAFFAEVVEPLIFPEMRDLVAALAAGGCELWAVSSTNEWVVRAGVRHFGIAAERVLAACVLSEGGAATGRLRRVPTGAEKAVALREVVHGPLDAAFGNSMHDLAMLEMAREPFAINPNPDLEQEAQRRAWPVHKPAR